MKATIYALLILLASSLSSSAMAEQPHPFQNELDQLDLKYQSYLTTHNSRALSRLYSKDAIAFYEYQPGLHNRQSIHAFYKKLFDTINIEHIKKERLESIKVGEYLFDLGYATFQFTPKANKSATPKQYRAKYLHIWKVDKHNNVQLYAEMFGSTQYLPAQEIPHTYTPIVDAMAHLYFPKNVSAELKREIEDENHLKLRAINNGDTQGRLDAFADNGRIGRIMKNWFLDKETLKPEISSVYIPENQVYAWHRYYRVFDLGDYILTFGHFQGGIGSLDNGGRFSGNTISLIHRTEDGRHPIFIQLAHNDEAFRPFKD